MEISDVFSDSGVSLLVGAALRYSSDKLDVVHGWCHDAPEEERNQQHRK